MMDAILGEVVVAAMDMMKDVVVDSMMYVVMDAMMGVIMGAARLLWWVQ